MRHTKRIKGAAAASLALALLTMPANAFTDTAGHWAEGAIDKWSQDYQLIQGYEDETFRPDASITRGAFAGILDRFLQFQQQSPQETFSDLADNFWEEAILKLHGAGVYLGTDGKALAQNSITRQQAVTMIARAFHLADGTQTLTYWDSDTVAEYARGPVAALTEMGCIADCWDGNFRPTDPITRAELLNILDNMIELLIQKPGEYSGEVAGTVMVNASEGAVLKDMTIEGDLILAPGVKGELLLDHVEVKGELRNFSEVEPLIRRDEKPEKPRDPDAPPEEPVPGILPQEVYEPGLTTGAYIEYGSRSIPVYEGVEPSRVGGEFDFNWSETHPDRLEYLGQAYETQFGIDISAHQNRASENNSIDWEAVRADGVDFVMVRGGLRGTSTGLIHEDAFFHQNVRGAMEAGLETGVYFFAQAVTVEEAIEEADFVIELLKTEQISGPVAYDWEMHDKSYRVYGTTPEMATACAIAFCQRIEEAGYEPMIYAGQYVSYVKYDQGAIDRYKRWYPEYKGASSEKLSPNFYYQMDVWQFSSKCQIAGIGGNVDANIRFLPIEAIE